MPAALSLSLCAGSEKARGRLRQLFSMLFYKHNSHMNEYISADQIALLALVVASRPGNVHRPQLKHPAPDCTFREARLKEAARRLGCGQ